MTKRGRVLESVSVCCLSDGGGEVFQLLLLISGVLLYSLSFAFFFICGITLSSLPLFFITLALLVVWLCLSAFTRFPAERFRFCLSPRTSSFQLSSPAAEFPTAARFPGFSLRSPPAPAASSPPSSSGEG